MKFTNEAAWDRVTRIGLGILLLFLGWSGAVTGGLGTVFKIVGFIPLLTGIVGWCPLYAMFRFRTNSSEGSRTLETA